MQRKTSLRCGALALLLLMLAACSRSSSGDTNVTTDIGLDAIPQLLMLALPTVETAKPSAMLGSFLALYVSETDIIDTKSAVMGVASLRMLLGTQEETGTEETYALIAELGQLLQVDIPDILNRSNNRPETLNAYMVSLTNVGTIAKKKQIALDELQDQKRDRLAAQRNVVTGIEREISTALKNEDYATAGSKQPALQEERQTLSTIENGIERTRETEDTLETLLTIAEARAQAIEQNREILIAGLKVLELPGIDDLGILEQVKTRDLSSPFGEEL